MPDSVTDPEIHEAFAAAKPSAKDAALRAGTELSNPMADLVHQAVSGAARTVYGGYKGIYKLATGQGMDAAAQAVTDEQAKTFQPSAQSQKAIDWATSGAKAATPGLQAINPQAPADAAAEFSASHGGPPLLSTALKAAPTAAGLVGTVTGGVRGAMEPAPMSAQEVIDRSSAGQSMGAAATSPNIKAISPQLQEAVVNAARKTGGAVNPDVLRAHIEADEHGVQLMKGQATRDPEQFTEEQNSTHPEVVSRINAQNGQMTDALDTIRRDASPTTVGNDYIENGRAAVDALKQYDEPIQADIRAKYKALIDANGGSVPIDTGKFLTNVDASLKKGFLTKTAASSPEISEILDSVRSNEPMDFEGYENARTRLAAAQRGGGSAGEAARIVRGELEQMPLSPAATKLKGLADTARSAAKARFDALEADPAYQASVDDVSAGNKKGSPSPLADTFLDKYALSKSAPKSQVDLMMQKIRATDPDAAGAVASHTLNAIRKAAINPNGNVLPNGYNGAIQKLEPKLGSLITPETKDSLDSLGRVITNAKVEPAGGKVNYSRSGVIARDALQSAAEGIANAKTGGLYGVAKKILNTSENSFAKDALRPGAGLEQLAPTAPTTGRGAP